MVNHAPESSPTPRLLPACILLVWLAACGPLFAQEQQRTTSEIAARKAPEGARLATLVKGANVATGRVQGGWIEVRLEGWIFERSVARTSRDGFDLLVIRKPSENLRRSPGGAILARVEDGALLNRIGRRGGWLHVSRDVWVPRSAFSSGQTTLGGRNSRSPSAAPNSAQLQTDTSRSRSSSRGAPVQVVKPAPLVETPAGRELGTLSAGSQGKVLARTGGWVRIQVEGWVREEDVMPGQGAALVGVSAAEIRASPSRYIGQVVQWRIQFVSLQKADELRPEIPSGEYYALARGPLPESGFVYVIVPSSRLEQFRALAPLQEIVIEARIKAAATRYLPNPVVELVG